MSDVDSKPQDPAEDQLGTAEAVQHPDKETKAATAVPSGADAKAEFICADFCDAIKTCPLYPGVAEVFLWRDIIRSALIFVIFNFYFFLVCIAEYSVVTLGSYLSLALIGASLAYSKFLAMKGNPKNFIEERVKETDFGVTTETLQRSVESFHKTLEASRKFALRVFSASDKVVTVATAAALLLISQLAKLLSGFGIIYIATLILFIWPRLYEEKKELIDAQAAKVYAQIKEKLEPLLAKVPGLKPKKD
jgi:hypothetical protein